MLDSPVYSQTQEFLENFGGALTNGDIPKICELFQDDCYWRDLVSFTWNIKTMESKEQIAEMLGESTVIDSAN